MKIIRSCCLFFFILFSYDFSGAQPVNPHMERLTLKDGLLDYNVKAMCQDKYGFIWIGSGSGLQKFDGTHFTNYQYSASDTTSISGNSISCIFEDIKGRLWIGTDGGGLNYFVREKNIFECVTKNKLKNSSGLRIKCIAEDNHKNIWFGTLGGLYKMNPETQQIVFYHYDSLQKESVSSSGIHALYFDNLVNTLYVGTAEGLSVYNEATNNFFNINNPYPKCTEPELWKPNWITNIFVEENKLWISTLKGELIRYNFSTRQIESMNERFHFLSEKAYEKYQFVSDHKGNLWISTVNDGLRRLNAATGEIDVIKSDLKNKNGLSSNGINTILKDKNETLWIGTDDGLNYFNLQRQFFEIIPVSNPAIKNRSVELFCLTRGKENSLWIGSRGSGLYEYNLNSGETNIYRSTKVENNFSGTIWDIFASANGVIWLGTNDGLTKFDVEKKTFENYQIDYLNWEGKQKHDIVKIYEDKHDTLWIMTWDGPLFIFDKKSKNFLKAYSIPNFQWLQKVRGIFSIVEDKKNRFWFGSLKEGLYCWHRTNNFVEHFLNEKNNPYSLSSDLIQVIYETSDSNVWVGTQNNHLNKYDDRNNKFIRFGQLQGIPDPYVVTIIEDSDKNLWIGTQKGLTLFNLKDSTVRTFDINDGLPDNSVFVNPVFLNDKRQIVYACADALVFFEPEKFKEQHLYSPVLITNIKLYDKLIANAEADGNKTKIELSPKDNFISIEFTALDFIHPNKVRYYYKLTGFNNEWIDNGDRRSVSFSNLAGGNYTFMVKCINADGVWSEPATVQIVKLLSFSQTVWFRMLLSVLIVSVILAYIRLRVTGLRKQKIHLESMVNLRTQQYKTQTERAERSEKFKEEFLANMSHEIRTPMNAVVGLSNLLISTPLNEKQKNYLNAIRESSVNLMVILNDILDLSKIEAGKIEFEKIEFNLKKVLKNVEDILRLKSEEKGLYLKTNIQPEIPVKLTGDPTRLNQVLMNLVGNAIKFTGKGGVTITIEKQKETSQTVSLMFRVSDTGIGISAENQEKIFESFAQEKVETTRKFGGTGLGLSISKKLVELQGGTIGVKSSEGNGSEFYFSMTYEIALNAESKIAINKSDLHPSEFNGLNVLIVEDNEFNQMVAVDTLLAFNNEMNVEIAENGHVAMNKVMEKKYDVILMDIQMPDIDGYMVTKQIRNSTNGINCKTPIIAMTANASRMEIEKCIAATMNEYVSKPFEPVNLFQKISKVLDKSNQME